MVGFWIALAVLVVGIVGGIVIAVVRGLAAWKQVKATSGDITAELDRISQESGQIERHLAAATASQARLAAAGDRLAASRARLQVQLAALGEARRTVDRLLWFLPGR
jgi:hypothetical protein